MITKPEYNTGLNNAERERLTILIEECGEVIQAASKVLRHGYESFNPHDPEKVTNRSNLYEEVGDVLYMIENMIKVDDLNGSMMTLHMLAKANQIKPYLHYQDEQTN